MSDDGHSRSWLRETDSNNRADEYEKESDTEQNYPRCRLKWAKDCPVCLRYRAARVSRADNDNFVLCERGRWACVLCQTMWQGEHEPTSNELVFVMAPNKLNHLLVCAGGAAENAERVVHRQLVLNVKRYAA